MAWSVEADPAALDLDAFSFKSELPSDIVLLEPASDPEWKKATGKKGVTVYERQPKGQKLKEAFGQAVFDGSPCQIMEILAKVNVFPEFMPNFKAAFQVYQEGNAAWYAEYLHIPWPFGNRFYHIKTELYGWRKEGACVLVRTWVQDEQTHALSRENVKRRVPDFKMDSITPKEAYGYWHLVGLEGDTKTDVHFLNCIDLGGSFPASFQNWAQGSSVVDVFEALRERLEEKKAGINCRCPLQ